MDDRSLVDGLIRGDAAAEAEFASTYRDRVIHALGALGVAAADREDVAQDILLNGWRNVVAGTFQQRSSLMTWLTTTIRGKAVDYLRQRISRRVHDHESIDGPSEIGARLAVPSAQVDPETALLAAETIGLLPLRPRLAFELWRRGDAVDEIAAALGVSAKRVRNLLAEAKGLIVAHVLGRGNIATARRLTGKNDE